MVVVVVCGDRKLREAYALALAGRGLEVLPLGSAAVAEAAILRLTMVGLLCDLTGDEDWPRVFEAAKLRGVPTVAIVDVSSEAQAHELGARVVIEGPVNPEVAAQAVHQVASGTAATLAATGASAI